MSLNIEAKTVNEVETESFDKRFVCNSDFSQYSVELVVRSKDGASSGVITVWDDRDLILNNEEVDVDLDELSVRNVAEWFDSFLMDDVNSFLHS